MVWGDPLTTLPLRRVDGTEIVRLSMELRRAEQAYREAFTQSRYTVVPTRLTDAKHAAHAAWAAAVDTRL